MSGCDNGKIIGLYNILYEKQYIVKEILSEYFLMSHDDISIKLRSSDLSVVVYTDVPIIRKNGTFSIIIVNRLDEYIYNYNDMELLDKFKLLVKNDNRLKVIKKLIKKSGH